MKVLVAAVDCGEHRRNSQAAGLGRPGVCHQFPLVIAVWDTPFNAAAMPAAFLPGWVRSVAITSLSRSASRAASIWLPSWLENGPPPSYPPTGLGLPPGANARPNPPSGPGLPCHDPTSAGFGAVSPSHWPKWVKSAGWDDDELLLVPVDELLELDDAAVSAAFGALAAQSSACRLRPSAGSSPS
jgi:hypothetical protein